jgi:hypothetical protein
MKVHVKGITEEHRTGKFWQKLDAEVDLDWKGDYTLDVEKNSTIHYKGTLTQTTDGVTTVSDKTSLGHFIGCAASMCPADTHYVKVNGTQKIDVSGKQTILVGAGQDVTVTGSQTWETTVNTKWDIGGKLDITVKGDHTLESASWHESIWGAKSEHVYGWKNDLVIGAHTDNHVGVHQEAHLVAHIELAAAIKMEAFLGIRLEAEMAAGIHLRGCEIADKRMRIQGGTMLAVKQALTRITAGTVRIAQGFHIIT